MSLSREFAATRIRGFLIIIVILAWGKGWSWSLSGFGVWELFLYRYLGATLGVVRWGNRETRSAVSKSSRNEMTGKVLGVRNILAGLAAVVPK